MIEQKAVNPAHEPDMTRRRRWDVDFLGPGMPFILARNIVDDMADGEELTEFPPTYEFENWRDFEKNAPEIGLDPEDYREKLNGG